MQKHLDSKKPKIMNYTALIRFGAGLVAGLLLGIGAGVGASEYDQTIEKEFQVSAGGKLVVQADRGSIEIKSDARDKIQVRVFRLVKGGSQAQADELFADHEVTFKQDGNIVSIVGRNKKDRFRLGRIRQPNMQVRYTIRLPRRFEVDLKTSGGDIRLGELDGSAITRTSSGSIEITTAKGQVEVKNSGGDVRIVSVDGETVASTSSGSIVIKVAKGKVDARNSGGKIEVNEARDVVLAHTSSGTIIVGLAAQPKADSHLEVSGGDIKVTLPRSAAIDVDARSNGGKVVSAFPVTSIVPGEPKPGALRGKINGGGSTLTLRASSGDIRLNESAATTR